jgi:preprotein translocase SecE subunit
MVIVVVIITSLFLAGIDWMLGALVRQLLGGG